MTTTITPEQADTLPAEAVELLPCPFCNGPARLHGPDRTSHHWHDVYVECVGDCGAQGEKLNIHMDDMEDPPERVIEWAIAAWNRRADDHYFAVDYTGCVHEAPDRETAIRWAEDFARTANGGAIGSERPEVAAAIGSLARRAAVPSEQEPVAWRCGECGCLTFARIEERGYDGHFHPGPTVRCVSCKVVSYWPEPTHPRSSNGVKVKPPKWHHEVAIGASTPEEWFATTPEGQSLTVTYDESCELPWVAHPFPPGPSNYATADEAKAALEAAREARIRRALDTGEPK